MKADKTKILEELADYDFPVVSCQGPGFSKRILANPWYRYYRVIIRIESHEQIVYSGNNLDKAIAIYNCVLGVAIKKLLRP
jgi:hypothetical protein